MYQLHWNNFHCLNNHCSRTDCTLNSLCFEIYSINSFIELGKKLISHFFGACNIFELLLLMLSSRMYTRVDYNSNMNSYFKFMESY